MRSTLGFLVKVKKNLEISKLTCQFFILNHARLLVVDSNSPGKVIVYYISSVIFEMYQAILEIPRSIYLSFAFSSGKKVTYPYDGII